MYGYRAVEDRLVLASRPREIKNERGSSPLRGEYYSNEMNEGIAPVESSRAPSRSASSYMYFSVQSGHLESCRWSQAHTT